MRHLPEEQPFELGRFAIPGLTGARRVRVWLPRGVRDKRVPTLYLMDGQNALGDEGSFSGGWHAHEVMGRRARKKRRAAAIVAIDHGNEHRIGDYSPFPTERFGEGRAPRFVDWLCRSLVPLVEHELPVLSHPDDRIIGGSSMGGLVSLYAFLARPDVIGRAMVMSPSLFLGRDALLSMARPGLIPWSHRCYLDGGRKEMRGFLSSSLPHVATRLTHAGLSHRHVKVRLDPRGGHDERTWNRRLVGALEWLFKRAL